MADYVSALNGQQMDEALTDVALRNSEAWAVGTRNGVNVTSADETYHNNAKYYAQVAQSAIPGTYTAAVRWDIAQGLAGEAQEQARANISAGASNRNLLDNPWFTVNQRGYTSNNLLQLQYWADRWLRNTSTNGQGSLSLSNGVVTLTAPSGSGAFGNILQRMADPSIINGKVVTLSLLKSDGTVIGGSVTRATGTAQTAYNSNNIKLQIAASNAVAIQVENGASLSFKAVKLELGSYSTLANDVPPDYGEELRKCARYFFRAKGDPLAVGYVSADKAYAYVMVNTPAPMRTAPSVATNGTFKVRGQGYTQTITAISSVSNPANTGSAVGLRMTLTSAASEIGACGAYGDSGAYIDLSADL